MAKFATAFKMKLNERQEVTLANGKKKNENKEVGEAMIPCPILADFGIVAEQANDKETGKPAFDNGLPLYADPRMDLLMDAVVNLISIRSRNKFENGKLKSGASLPEDFDALFEQSGRTGDALALRREAKVDFESYLQKLGKKANTVALLSDVFQNSSKVLNGASENVVNALSSHVQNWIGTLDETKQARFSPKIKELQESINTAIAGVDLDDLAA